MDFERQKKAKVYLLKTLAEEWIEINEGERKVVKDTQESYSKNLLAQIIRVSQELAELGS